MKRKKPEAPSATPWINSQLLKSVVDVRPDLVRALLVQGANPETKDKDGHTTLMHIVQFAPMVKSLDQEATAYFKHSAHGIITRQLLSAGADVNARSSSGKTALMYTALKESSSVVAQSFAASQLLAAGADVNAQDTLGKTALIYAALTGYAPMVTQLLQAGASVNIEDSLGNTALIYAIEQGFKTVVGQLLAAGANLHAPDENVRSGLSLRL